MARRSHEWKIVVVVDGDISNGSDFAPCLQRCSPAVSFPPVVVHTSEPWSETRLCLSRPQNALGKSTISWSICSLAAKTHPASSRLITDSLKASLQNHNVYQSKTFSAMIH